VRSETFVSASGKSAGRGLGAVVIDRPVADVWATLIRYEDRAQYIPRLKSVDVLERQPGRLRIRQEIDATFLTARFTAWFRLDREALTISWSLDKSATDNTIAESEGEYRMTALDPGHTLLVYRTYVDSGLKVPKSIQSYMQRRSIPELLGNIKKRVESGGTWQRH
jgi:carbon monoxide dehydrogenase subunit G